MCLTKFARISLSHCSWSTTIIQCHTLLQQQCRMSLTKLQLALVICGTSFAIFVVSNPIRKRKRRGPTTKGITFSSRYCQWSMCKIGRGWHTGQEWFKYIPHCAWGWPRSRVCCCLLWKCSCECATRRARFDKIAGNDQKSRKEGNSLKKKQSRMLRKCAAVTFVYDNY